MYLQNGRFTTNTISTWRDGLPGAIMLHCSVYDLCQIGRTLEDNTPSRGQPVRMQCVQADFQSKTGCKSAPEELQCSLCDPRTLP